MGKIWWRWTEMRRTLTQLEFRVRFSPWTNSKPKTCMDGRVRLTINGLSQSFDYFGPYFLLDLVWPALVWPPPHTIDINEPSLQIKHAKHDKFYFVHTNEISHLNIQVVYQASQKKYTPWNKAWANSSRKSFTIGREPGAPHAPREELVIVALEEGSVEPKPREPLRR